MSDYRVSSNPGRGGRRSRGIRYVMTHETSSGDIEPSFVVAMTPSEGAVLSPGLNTPLTSAAVFGSSRFLRRERSGTLSVRSAGLWRVTATVTVSATSVDRPAPPAATAPQPTVPQRPSVPRTTVVAAKVKVNRPKKNVMSAVRSAARMMRQAVRISEETVLGDERHVPSEERRGFAGGDLIEFPEETDKVQVPVKAEEAPPPTTKPSAGSRQNGASSRQAAVQGGSRQAGSSRQTTQAKVEVQPKAEIPQVKAAAATSQRGSRQRIVTSSDLLPGTGSAALTLNGQPLVELSLDGGYVLIQRALMLKANDVVDVQIQVGDTRWADVVLTFEPMALFDSLEGFSPRRRVRGCRDFSDEDEDFSAQDVSEDSGPSSEDSDLSNDDASDLSEDEDDLSAQGFSEEEDLSDDQEPCHSDGDLDD